jgi:hypothetical protein
MKGIVYRATILGVSQASMPMAWMREASLVQVGEEILVKVENPAGEGAIFEERSRWHDTEAAAVGEVIAKLEESKSSVIAEYDKAIAEWREKLISKEDAE